jgi:hypothetical protein
MSKIINRSQALGVFGAEALKMEREVNPKYKGGAEIAAASAFLRNWKHGPQVILLVGDCTKTQQVVDAGNEYKVCG